VSSPATDLQFSTISGPDDLPTGAETGDSTALSSPWGSLCVRGP
jgi:hypothetical protein